MTSSTTTSLKIPAELKERVRLLAAQRRRTPHWILREAVEQYVNREEARQRQIRDSLAAWQQFQKDGLHATAAEADQWLARLEAGEDVEPPVCHG